MMKLIKRTEVLVLVFLFGTMLSLSAQQDSQYTQYMYNTVSINPAYAGNRGVFSAFGVYRTQWVGLDGAPETLNFSVNTPTGFERVGVGLSFTSDRIGPSSENIITADFSYTIPINRWGTKLSFGLKAGISTLDIDISKLNIYNPNDVNLVNQSLLSPVVGAGLYLHHNNRWYIGLSSPNILQTKHYDEVAVSTATEKMHFYLIGGYVFDLRNNIKFKPAVLAKAVGGSTVSVDVSANFLMYDRFSMGLSYRWNAAVSAMAGFRINENIMIGYSYDFNTTELGRYNSGSHEIFLRYELGSRRRNRINPRFF